MTGPVAASPPPLSIGLPVYNGEAFLVEVLDSLLYQTYGDFELIVSDNGSTDATAEICRSYERADARVAYHRSSENRGAAWNYNRVLALARGPYFKWAPADDMYEPRYLERCMEVMLGSPPSVVLVYPWSRVIDERGTEICEWEHYDGLDTRGLLPHERLARLVERPPNMGTSIFGVTRTGALRRTRGHGTFLSADFIVLAELALIGEFVEIYEHLFVKRFHRQMSREANRTDTEWAEWFEPGGGRRVQAEYWTLFFQHLVSIHRAELAGAEKARCYGAFIPGWVRVWHALLWSELIALPQHVGARAKARLL